MTEPATTPPPDEQEDLRAAMARRAQRVLAEPKKEAAPPPPASPPPPAAKPARSEGTPRRTAPKKSPKDAFNDLATVPPTPTSDMNAKFAALVEVSDLMALGRLPNHRFKSASIYDQEIGFYHRIFRHQGLQGKSADLAASQLEIDENTHLIDRPRVFQAWATLHNLPHYESEEFVYFMTDTVKTAHFMRGGAGVTGYIRGIGRKISNAFGGSGHDY